MSQTITFTVPQASLVIAAIATVTGAAVLFTVRGMLVDAIAAMTQIAGNDAKSARWLWLRGYRKSPHAGPDVTPEPVRPEHTPACPDLFYCPTVDEVESGCHGGFDVCCAAPELHHPVTEPLALSDRTHADEQADHTDTDRAGMWRVLLGLASDLVDRVHDWLPGLLRQRAERDKVGSGEQAVDPDRPLREVLAASDYELERDDLAISTRGLCPVGAWKDGQGTHSPEWWACSFCAHCGADGNAAPEPEPVTIVRVNHRYRRPGDTGLFPLVKVVGDKAAGRHRAEPEMPAINVPAQRTGDADE